MSLQFRERQLAETELRYLQERAREEARSRELLAKCGIPQKPGAADLLSGRIKMWECVDNSQVVGSCVTDSGTGEVISVQVDSLYRGQGIGRQLLSLGVRWMRSAGAKRIWLAAPADPAARAYGFYRALGWVPTGERVADGGDEILELPLHRD